MSRRISTEWMMCLNTFACRRQVAKGLQLPIRNLHWPFPKSALRRLLFERPFPSYVCIMKQTGEDEAHWVSVAADRGGTKVTMYNSSVHYDMRDVTAFIGDLCRQLNCRFEEACTTHLQLRTDYGCQTWSLVTLFAHHRKLHASLQLYKKLTRRIARSRVMKAWVEAQMQATEKHQ